LDKQYTLHQITMTVVSEAKQQLKV